MVGGGALKYSEVLQCGERTGKLYSFVSSSRSAFFGCGHVGCAAATLKTNLNRNNLSFSFLALSLTSFSIVASPVLHISTRHHQFFPLVPT